MRLVNDYPMTWQATPGSFTDQWLPLQAHYLATWEQRVSVLRRGLITLTVMLSHFRLGGKNTEQRRVLPWFCLVLFELCFKALQLTESCMSFFFHLPSLLVLLVFLFLSHLPCYIQQLHPAPFNKINPNRKHSEEINSGLERLDHPFGLTAAAKTHCL